jgi:hypothetical protein
MCPRRCEKSGAVPFTIALSGVVPLTKCLLEHPEVVAGSTARVAGLAAATDAALAAAGDVNADALDREGIRELSKQKREKERRSRNGMTIDDDGVAPGDLGEEEGALLAAMDKVKAKGGAMFAAAQQLGNRGGLELTSVAVRSVAGRLATANVEKQKKKDDDAEMRRIAGATEAGRAAAAGGGRAPRASWKAIAAERETQHKELSTAQAAQIREQQATGSEQAALIRELRAKLAELEAANQPPG